MAIGSDLSVEAIKMARTKYPQTTFIIMDVLKECNEDTRKYSLLTLFEAIEHIKFSQGKQLLKYMYWLLNPGGIAIISTPRDINDKYNTFHVSEWSYGTLKNECGSVFDEVTIYGQDWATGKISQDNVREGDFYVVVCKKT